MGDEEGKGSNNNTNTTTADPKPPFLFSSLFFFSGLNATTTTTTTTTPTLPLPDSSSSSEIMAFAPWAVQAGLFLLFTLPAHTLHLSRLNRHHLRAQIMLFGTHVSALALLFRFSNPMLVRLCSIHAQIHLASPYTLLLTLALATAFPIHPNQHPGALAIALVWPEIVDTCGSALFRAASKAH